MHQSAQKLSCRWKEIKSKRNTNLYVVSGSRSSSRNSVIGSTIMGCLSLMTMLYDVMSLPLQLGSCQDSTADVALGLTLMVTIAEGLEGGVIQDVVEENWPGPALLIAYTRNQIKITGSQKTFCSSDYKFIQFSININSFGSRTFSQWMPNEEITTKNNHEYSSF